MIRMRCVFLVSHGAVIMHAGFPCMAIWVVFGGKGMAVWLLACLPLLSERGKKKKKKKLLWN
jgi:hypothetical protein